MPHVSTSLHEHRPAEGQIADEQANDNVVASMVTTDPGFLGKQRALYEPMRSARKIRHERWQLCVLQAEKDALFVEFHVKVAEEKAQAAAHVICFASAAPPPWFITRRHEHEAGTSTSGGVNEAAFAEEK